MLTVWTDLSKVHEVKDVIATSATRTEIITKLGLTTKDARNYHRLNDFVKTHHLQVDHLWKQGKLKRDYWDSLDDVIKQSFSVVEVIEKLGIKQHGSNHERVRAEIAKRGLDTSHFDPSARRNTASKITHRSVIRKRVLKYNLIPYVCVGCGNDGNWMGTKLTLQLDHIDGDSANNIMDNLRFLCPNCHTQTGTWGNQH